LSTNYYCRNKKEYQEWLKKEEWLDGIIKSSTDQLIILDLEKWVINSIEDKIKYEYTEQADYHTFEEFHIGKRSRGQFKLEVQPNYKADLKFLFEWLDTHNTEYEVFNEYGETLTVTELKQIILGCEYAEKWINFSFS
jgi:hypothetical protein